MDANICTEVVGLAAAVHITGAVLLPAVDDRSISEATVTITKTLGFSHSFHKSVYFFSSLSGNL